MPGRREREVPPVVLAGVDDEPAAVRAGLDELAPQLADVEVVAFGRHEASLPVLS